MAPKHIRLHKLAEQIAACRACPLADSRARTVPGGGNPDARVMLVGEGPGAVEDQTGLPFMGRSRAFLDECLEIAGLRRADVWLANTVKCRPPGNRDPRPEELNTCLGWLWAQMIEVKPAVIVAMGRIASQTLSRTNESLASLQARAPGELVIAPAGNRTNEPPIIAKLMCTYHPTAAQRFPAHRIKMRQDFERLRGLLS